MEREADNLMDFNKTVNNVSPNSKFMKPLIEPVKVPEIRIRTITDPSRLSLDNNPFDKALRQAILQNIDDPFESALKTSLQVNLDNSNSLKATLKSECLNTDFCQKSADTESPNSVDEYNDPHQNLDVQDCKADFIASPSAFDLFSQCRHCLHKKQNRSGSNTCLCEVNLSKCEKTSLSVLSFESSASTTAGSLHNKAYVYDSSKSGNLDSINLEVSEVSEQSSALNKAFMEEKHLRTSSVGSIQSDNNSIKNIIKERCKSIQDLPKFSWRVCPPLTEDENEVDLNSTVFDEANQIANMLQDLNVSNALVKKASSNEDLESVEPVWSEALSDNETLEKEKAYISPKLNNATPKAKQLLNDIKKVIENKEISEKDLDGILCSLSDFRNGLNLNKNVTICERTNCSIENKPSFIKNDVNVAKVAEKSIPAKNVFDGSSKNKLKDSTIIKEKIPEFFECLQKMSSTSDCNLIEEMIISLYVLLQEKKSNDKENESPRKLATISKLSTKFRRSNSVGNRENLKKQIQNASLDSPGIGRSNVPCLLTRSVKSYNNITALRNSQQNSDVTLKNKSSDKNIAHDIVKPKNNHLRTKSKTLRPIKALQIVPGSTSKLLVVDSHNKQDSIETSTPNLEVFQHNGAFVFSTPDKRLKM